MYAKFKDRLKLAIKGESVNSFAKKCGVRESLLRKYLTGLTIPGMDKLISIANTANVKIEWLATGNGPMRDNQGLFDLKLMMSIIGGLNDYEKKLGKAFTSTEKTLIIIFTYYELYSYLGRELDQKKISIIDTIEGVEIYFSRWDSMIEKDKDDKFAADFFKKIFSGFLSEEDAALAARELIDARLSRLHIK